MKLLLTLSAIAMLSASALCSDAPIQHVVHFKFKSTAEQAQVEKLVEAFAALKTKIPVVQAIQYGTNVSPEGLDRGFTHCWIVTFKNAADRDTYLTHPDHKAFVSMLLPSLEEALVVDFVVKTAP